jgi:hypothetical protein
MYKKRIATFFLFAMSVAIASAQDMQPGMYSQNISLEPASGPARNFQDKECLTPKDVSDGLTRIGIESDTECKVQNLVKGGGKISYRLICEEDGKKLPSDVSGTYSTDSYDFVVRNTSGYGPYKVIRVKGKRSGPCK